MFVRQSFHDLPEAEQRRRAAIKKRETADREAEEKFDSLSIGQLEVRAKADIRQAAEKAAAERRFDALRELILGAPELVNSAESCNGLLEELRQIFIESGRVWDAQDPDWRRGDLFLAADRAARKGTLELRGPWTRKSPSELEVYSMPLEQLRELANFGELDERRNLP